MVANNKIEYIAVIASLVFLIMLPTAFANDLAANITGARTVWNNYGITGTSQIIATSSQ